MAASCEISDENKNTEFVLAVRAVSEKNVSFDFLNSLISYKMAFQSDG